jgi:hypothetical protein
MITLQLTKAEVLLKMAGLPYTIYTGGFKKAPKGQAATFIRWHLEKSTKSTSRQRDLSMARQIIVEC